jgi:N-acetyl-anhydromuramyl-L-alanine amidase AmpD
VPAPSTSSEAASSGDSAATAQKLYEKLHIESYNLDSERLVHGDKPVEFQKYIVLHDTEGDGEPEGIIDYCEGNERQIAAHFVVGKDGRIVQCVSIDKIAHHAGYGDTGHNEFYGVEEDSRDDKAGSTPIGDWASDYGMNSYSVGIEMVHVGGSGDYPEEQLKALDGLIAYLDAAFGKECQIIDHKAWRSGNSDMSEEFAEYFANYQDHRTHD